MSNPRNSGTNPDDRMRSINESDQGRREKSTDQGRLSRPPAIPIPLPEKPKK